MARYSSPGVYVEEVSGGVKPIAGVGTSTGAFVGLAEKGDIGKAKLITNWSQYVKEFGSFIPNGYLAYAVYASSQKAEQAVTWSGHHPIKQRAPM